MHIKKHRSSTRNRRQQGKFKWRFFLGQKGYVSRTSERVTLIGFNKARWSKNKQAWVLYPPRYTRRSRRRNIIDDTSMKMEMAA